MKLKIFSIAVLFIALHAFTFASTVKLGGKVTDVNTKNGIPGVTVSIPELRLSVVTNDKGEFIFNHLARKGRVLLEVTFIGYQTLTQIVDLSTTSSFDFILSPSTIEVKEVVITGTAFSASNKKNSTSASIVSHEDLLTKPANNIIDAISHVPGVSQITTGNAISKPVIRGLSYNRVVTVANGVKQEGNQFGDEHGIEIDQFSAGRVEVLRGAASLLYGSDALGGVINIENPVPVPDPEGRMHAEFLSNYNTNSGLTSNSLMFAENRNGFVYRVHGTYKNAYSFQTPTGYYPNSGYIEANYDLQAGLNRPWGYVHLDFSSFHDKIGFYDPDNITGTTNANAIFTNGNMGVYSNSDFKDRRLSFPNQDVRHLKVAVNSNIQLGEGKIKSVFGYQRNIRQEIPDPNSTSLYLDLNAYSYDLKYYFKEKNGWEPVLGTSAEFQYGDNTSVKANSTLIPSYHSSAVGLFAYLKKTWSTRTVDGGIRWDYRGLDGMQYLNRLSTLIYPAFKNNVSNVSGALGFTQECGKYLSFKTNAGTAFRGANIAELASNGVHEGTFRYEIGNPNLSPERSYQVDASFSYSSDQLEASLGGFLNYINNYIYYINTNQETILVGTDNIPVYRFVQNDAALRGVEASFTVHPVKYVHFENIFSYVFAKNRTLNKPLPLIPAANLRNELKFEPTIKGLSKSYIFVALDNYFNQNRVDDFETATIGYSLIDVGVGTTIRLKRQQLTLYIAAKNLADQKYYNALSQLKPGRLDVTRPDLGIYNPGRNIIFGVFMPLSIKRW